MHNVNYNIIYIHFSGGSFQKWKDFPEAILGYAIPTPIIPQPITHLHPTTLQISTILPLLIINTSLPFTTFNPILI